MSLLLESNPRARVLCEKAVNYILLAHHTEDLAAKMVLVIRALEADILALKLYQNWLSGEDLVRSKNTVMYLESRMRDCKRAIK